MGLWKQICTDPSDPDAEQFEVHGLGGSWFRYAGDGKFDWQRDFFDFGHVSATYMELIKAGRLSPGMQNASSAACPARRSPATTRSGGPRRRCGRSHRRAVAGVPEFRSARPSAAIGFARRVVNGTHRRSTTGYVGIDTPCSPIGRPVSGPTRRRTTMKTKGALLWEFNKPWSIEEIEIGDPVKDEVKIRMEAAGMCHSDHHLMTGDIPMAGFPVLGGHEGAGVVTEVGPGVEDIAPGDHVVLSFIPSCGRCVSCQAGLRNLCDLGAMLLNGVAVSDGTHRVHARGQGVFPMTLLGTFSPWMVVHKSSVVKIDPAIPFEVASWSAAGSPPGSARRCAPPISAPARTWRSSVSAGSACPPFRARSPPGPATSSSSNRSSGNATRH